MDRVLGIDIVIKWLKTQGPFLKMDTTQRHLELPGPEA